MDELATLIARRDYLTHRITAKQNVGWDWLYDERERDALTWAIERLADTVNIDEGRPVE